MHARVVTWEGGDAESMRRSAEEMARSSEGGPPEGLPAVGFTLLVDPENGQAMAITLFETEEKLQQGHETLMAMQPPADGRARASAGFYEVAVDRRL